MALKKFSYGKDRLTLESSMKILNGDLNCHIEKDVLEKINNSRGKY